jgi:hypothetical protein
VQKENFNQILGEPSGRGSRITAGGHSWQKKNELPEFLEACAKLFGT